MNTETAISWYVKAVKKNSLLNEQMEILKSQMNNLSLQNERLRKKVDVALNFPGVPESLVHQINEI